MELSNDWHKRTNVRLADILSDILKETRTPKVPKPTHGYRIAEKAPEIVTAPGAYFPEKKGRVIPLEPRQVGGPVKPASTRTLQQMLEKLASYAPFPISGAATQSTTARQRVEGQGENRLETAIEPKPLPLVPRQDGGEVDPSLFKETFSVNSGAPTQQGIEAAANTASLKDTPLNVSPPTPSLQSFAPGANSTPTGPSTPLAGPEPIGTTAPAGQGNSINNSMEQRLNSISRGLSLMIKPPKAFKYKGLQHGFESEQRAAYDKKNKPYQDFMSSLNPTPLFSRAGGGSTSPDPFEGLSEEELKKLYEGIKAFSVESLASSHPVTAMDKAFPEYQGRIGHVPLPFDATTKSAPPKTEPVKQIEGGISGNLLKLQGGHGNVVDMAPNASGTFEQKGVPVMTETLKGETTIPTIPKIESTFKPLAPLPSVIGATKKEETAPKALTGSLSDISKDILPSGETRYTFPGTEGTATVESQDAYLKRIGGIEGVAKAKKIVSDRWAAEEASTPEAMELAERKKWATPGYGEAQRAKRQKESDLESIKGGLPKSTVISVSPGYEKTYYEAHPEERFMDMTTEANKPLMDAFLKMIEQNQNIIKGNFGDVTMGRRAKREARNAAIASLPHLQQGLAQLQASNAAMPEMKKTPILNTNEDKYSMTLYGQSYRELDESKRKIVDTKVAELKPPSPVSAPTRKSEKTFDAKTGQSYQQDFEWREGTWQPVGEKRVVGGPVPQDKEGLKINKLKEIRSLLDEDYANQIGADVKDLQKKLSPIQKEAYNRILAFAEKTAETMAPRAALDEALKYWYSTFGQEQKKPQKQRKPLSSFERE